MNDALTWIAASLIAACLAASMLLDGPSELQATQDVAAEVAALTGGCK